MANPYTATQWLRLSMQQQGLLSPHAPSAATASAGSGAVAALIRQLSYVQIDAINVVERAHHHVLHSRLPFENTSGNKKDHDNNQNSSERVGGYTPCLLDEAVRDKTVFEYWSHAAAYLPMEDYRFSLYQKQKFKENIEQQQQQNKKQDTSSRWLFGPRAQKVMREVLARIRSDGPLKASQITLRRHNNDDDDVGGGVNSGATAAVVKKALDQLFMQGDLMIAGRENFQKVYDLPERVLPKEMPCGATSATVSVPTEAEFARYLITRYLTAHGFGNVQQIQYLRPSSLIKTSTLNETLKQMCEEGLIASFTMGVGRRSRGKRDRNGHPSNSNDDDDDDDSPPSRALKKNGGTSSSSTSSLVYYYLPSLKVPTAAQIPNKVWLLNPFDNLVIQRQKLEQWFDFDYQVEIYVTEAKRQYGYYSLPILWRDRFVGRVDVKADRKNQCLLLQNLHLEPNLTTTTNDEGDNASASELEDKKKTLFVSAFVDAVNLYSAFNRCKRWQLVQCNDAAIAKMIKNKNS